MMTRQHDGDELLRAHVRKLEGQVHALTYLTKAVLALLRRIANGESIPIEQIDSLDKAIDTLNQRSRR